MEDTLLPKWLALPIFASDPLSSVAYATEAAMVVLVAASAAPRTDVFPISIAIAILLAIVVASYRQTVMAYEPSGGAYIVAKENLGKLPSLVAAAALLVDYVLTVAVSVASGIFAITSAVSSLAPYRVALSLAAIGLIAFVNLRGVREAGFLFAIPTYGFIVAIYITIGRASRAARPGRARTRPFRTPLRPGSARSGARDPARFLVGRLRADRRRGDRQRRECVQAAPVGERRDDPRRARYDRDQPLPRCLVARGPHARAAEHDRLGALADRTRSLPGRWRARSCTGSSRSTFAILVLAANTSYQGFPRLSALLAKDGFVARQFTNLGDRLVFSNGVLVLTAAAMG